MTKCRIATMLQIIGYGLILWGVFADGQVDATDLRGIGIAAVLCSLMWYFWSRARADDESIYEAGRQAGYDAGWGDGRRAARPVVVSLEERRERQPTG